jgi:sialate O-acetylesterase
MKRIVVSLAILVFALNTGKAEVTLARIFGNNMVLQQNAPIPVWGWAAPGEKVAVWLAKQALATRAGNDGKWMLTFKPIPAGGPYELVVQGKNQLRIKNILIGEVWVCSGQSNMEFPVSRAMNSEEEMNTAQYPKIRLFTVAKKISLTPLNDLEEGEWVECSPETVGNFSAVGYFFGRELFNNLNVPIGLIHSSWGGTNAESWTSKETMSQLPDFKGQMEIAAKSDLATAEKNADAKMKEWALKIENEDAGRVNKWEKSGLNTSDWQEMELPGLWETKGLPDFDGVVWFRKEITLDASELGDDIKLSLGPIDDNDQTYVNGTLVGSTIQRYSEPRIYKIEKELLSAGTNVIVVRVTDTGGGGGIWGEKNQMFLQLGNRKIQLAGSWRYKVGIVSAIPPQANAGPNAFPTLLFNAMINPIIPFAIKGAIWYQGENNAGRAYQYRSLFPAMIKDWRVHWREGDFPFLFVQLANYMKPKDDPFDSEWAELREAQAMTLSLPNTGMALAIDIGSASDIHPTNKQDVGKRLALNALKKAYNQDVVFSGPTFQSMTAEGNKLRLNFTNMGSGLIAKDRYGYIKGFAIAGADKIFYWATALLDGNSIILWSDKVPNPVAVRYAWADNPDDANLYNLEGLPAVPFRTDSWRGLTEGRK